MYAMQYELTPPVEYGMQITRKRIADRERISDQSPIG